jgi:zinc transport system substrate-binding protein
VFRYFVAKREREKPLQNPAGPVRSTFTGFCAAVTALLLIVACLFFSGCAGQKETPASNSPDFQPVKVFCTIYPLYDFAKNIGKDKIDLSCLVPPGTEPHEWEPTPRDLASIQEANLFVYCGAGMESWVDKVLNVVAGPELNIVNASRGIQLISGQGEEDEVGVKQQNSGDTSEDQVALNISGDVREDHSAVDPHIWVDPVNAMKMVENIAAGLVQADPANKLFYETNAREYLNELEALHNDYRNGLARTTHREFITSHAAFGYLAKRYGLVQVPIRGLSPEVEPAPARMAEIIKLINEKRIRYIFFETLVSPKVSQIIAGEAGAGTLVLNPLGNLTTDEIDAGKDYLTVMRENLVNLQKALEVAES